MANIYDTAQYILDAIKRSGADEGSCVVDESLKDELVTANGALSLKRTAANMSVSVKVIKGGRKGMATTNGTNAADLDEAVAAAAASADSAPADGETLAPGVGERSFKSGAVDGDLDALYSRTAEIIDSVNREYPKVVFDIYSAAHTKSTQVFASTSGSLVTNKTGFYSLFPCFSARDGQKVSSFNAFIYRTNDISQPFLDTALIRMYISDTEKQIDTRSLSGKRIGKVLLTPSALFSFLYPCIERSVGDNAIISGVSPWHGKIGERVAAENINLSIVPLDARITAGERVTEDGFISENYDIIKDGVLKAYALSGSAARKTGFDRAPNTSRAMLLGCGEQSLEQLIAGIDYGILLNRFSGSSPGVSGDFSGVAKNSYLIENGKITDAISEVMVSGNFHDMLRGKVELGCEGICDGGTILPWTVFDGVTISGK